MKMRLNDIPLEDILDTINETDAALGGVGYKRYLDYNRPHHCRPFYGKVCEDCHTYWGYYDLDDDIDVYTSDYWYDYKTILGEAQ